MRKHQIDNLLFQSLYCSQASGACTYDAALQNLHPPSSKAAIEQRLEVGEKNIRVGVRIVDLVGVELKRHACAQSGAAAGVES